MMASPASVQDVSWQHDPNSENALSENQSSMDANEPTKSECDLDQKALDLVKNVEEIHTNLTNAQRHREKTVEIVSSMELPVFPSNIDKRLDDLEISFALGMVMDAMRWEIYALATLEAKRALDIANRQGNEVNIARCYYWMGRIQLEQDDIPSAYKFFLAALPCAMADQHVEGSSVGWYLNFSHPTLGEEFRRRVSTVRCRTTPKGTLTKVDRNHSDDKQSRKRKQEAWISELVLRPSTSAGPTQVAPVTAKENRKQNSRPVVWEAKNTEDALHANSPLVIFQKGEINADGMEWLAVANSGPRLPQSKFTFRCYFNGLAPRTRPTKIFPEQPGENILSAEEWQALHQRFQNKRVTLAYLEFERWQNFKSDSNLRSLKKLPERM